MGKMKNSEVAARYMSLADIINRKEKYPVKFSFALSKNTKKLEELHKDFEEARNKLLDDYNVKAGGEPAYKETGRIEIAPEHEAAWKQAMGELLEIEVDTEIHTVELSALDGIDIEPDVLYACDFMIQP